MSKHLFARAFRSRCQHHPKREPRQDVIGGASRSRLRFRLRLARRTRGDRLATRGRLDQRRVYHVSGFDEFVRGGVDC